MPPIDSSLLCHDLPSKHQPEIGTNLVTGATGYIGGRLVPELLARGYKVRVMARAVSDDLKDRWPGVEIVVADALNAESLRKALEGIHAAYYLIHSLLCGPEEFEAKEIQAAENFRNAAKAEGVARIIYLGALGDVRASLSPHLRSRMQVAEELGRGPVPTTALRAAIIIGSGSASYEIVEHLVKNLPMFLIPRWAQTRCQPIAIRDVIKYLVGVLETPETRGKSFDIGGSDILTYKQMMEIFAGLLGRRRLFVPCPFCNIRFFSYLASLFTPVPAAITACLMQGITSEVVCKNEDIKRLLAFQPLGYREALVRAMSREEQDKVHTRWSDAYPPAHELAMKLHEIKGPVRYTDEHSILSDKDASSLFRSICRIGGKEGWFYSNWLWRLRGMIDRLLLGVGSSRGRRSWSSLRVGDVIDFWRVESLRPDDMLLLRAEMKLPGKAWLQFNVDPHEGRNRLSVKAYYQPAGVFGKPYWYACLPFHFLIFQNLIKQIEKRA
ncbi:MAG: SDR family oxidoreductase [Planctomycetaceae bacterium]|nr:MAG: SDR family oxidoreductase [Planctomycetaceae bacterium]